ncbi:meteorin-like protein isoform X2 [Hoplias malabaricus]|uniref:meteorin-like protein isoform X2 n=1 Tax=Hoplias malabaricus TaxID=27720 RepID=UPI003463104A
MMTVYFPLALLVLCGGARGGVAQYSSDQCSWRGSGLTHQSHVRDVEQVYLRCSEGSLEWLYPTGAVIVNLRPNTDPTHTPTHTACLRPRPGSSGASVYLQKDGSLSLLLSDDEQASGRQRCFDLHQQAALFIQATAHLDISKRVTAFQYQLFSAEDSEQPHSAGVLRGSIQAIEDDGDDEDGVWMVVSSSHVFRQKKRVFVSAGGTRGHGRWTGRIKVPKRCGGLGTGQRAEFLLTGSVRFGEAWLGCAPRYKDFLQIYHAAVEAGNNPCNVDTD